MATYYGKNKVDVGVYIETDRLVLSAEEYAAIPVKDPNTMYLVYDDPLLVDIMRHMEDKKIHGGIVRHTVTLLSSGWVDSGSESTQTIDVEGILADEAVQLITILPSNASKSIYDTCSVYASTQSTDSLTFTCSEVPTSDLTVYVLIQEVA